MVRQTGFQREMKSFYVEVLMKKIFRWEYYYIHVEMSDIITIITYGHLVRWWFVVGPSLLKS